MHVHVVTTEKTVVCVPCYQQILDISRSLTVKHLATIIQPEVGVLWPFCCFQLSKSSAFRLSN